MFKVHTILHISNVLNLVIRIAFTVMAIPHKYLWSENSWMENKTERNGDVQLERSAPAIACSTKNWL